MKVTWKPWLCRRRLPDGPLGCAGTCRPVLDILSQAAPDNFQDLFINYCHICLFLATVTITRGDPSDSVSMIFVSELGGCCEADQELNCWHGVKTLWSCSTLVARGSTSKISKGEIFLSFQFLWNQRSTTKQKNTIQVKSLILVPAMIVRLGITSTGRQHSLNWVSWLWCPSGVSCSNNNNQCFRASYTPQWIRLKFITWSRRSSLRCNQSRSRYMVNSVEHSGIPSL